MVSKKKPKMKEEQLPDQLAFSGSPNAQCFLSVVLVVL
jgi:hypothetical protein